MKEFIDLIVKNKYVIVCVAIIVLLYMLGIIEFLADLAILCILIGLAIYVGKKLQDGESFFKDLFKDKFKKKDSNVFYYKDSDKDE